MPWPPRNNSGRRSRQRSRQTTEKINLNDKQNTVCRYSPPVFTPKAVDRVEVYFQDLRNHLMRHIQRADAVFGCVAWLTSKDILRELSRVQCSVVVQKEDFLRPDLSLKDSHRKILRQAYTSLYCTILKKEFPDNFMLRIDPGGRQEIYPIRCVGLRGSGGRWPSPKSHHKFVVFCEYRKKTWRRVGNDEYLTPGKITPYAVWTGSFNFTENSQASLENAVVIHDQAVALAYLEEYARVYALSESLDWKSKWTAPEFKIGDR